MRHQEYVEKTANHYTKQWGPELDFKNFVKTNPEAVKVLPARQLPWSELFARIRAQASARPVHVYDAACGFGDIMTSLTAEPNPTGLTYLGVDLHDALNTIARPSNAVMVQGDITSPVDGCGPFDFILCRAAIHHTPDPPATYRTLVSQLAPGGTIAITAYAKKAPMREAVDDALRSQIVPMDNDMAFATANQITRLGRDLQAAGGSIIIEDDLPFLGIKAGIYTVQGFIYQYFMKCWHNSGFSERHCDLVNFDWYHPPFAYRFALPELIGWAEENGLAVTRTASIEAQHYLEAVA
jgi:SAM-dependent methyltransferase